MFLKQTNVLKKTSNDRLAALKFAVMNIASIWTSQRLDDESIQVWTSKTFKQATDSIVLARERFTPKLDPRIVIVSKEEGEGKEKKTVGGGRGHK